MCMYDMSGSAPVDLFEMIRKIIDYLSPAIDIKWIGIINCVRWFIDHDNITVSNENIGLVSQYISISEVNMTRINNDPCTSLKSL